MAFGSSEPVKSIPLLKSLAGALQRLTEAFSKGVDMKETGQEMTPDPPFPLHTTPSNQSSFRSKGADETGEQEQERQRALRAAYKLILAHLHKLGGKMK